MTEMHHCSDLDAEIDSLIDQGYRLDMITPADSPREAQLSKGDDVVRLVSEPPAVAGGSDFCVQGRAGMEYRDLFPDRLGGKLIASHIRLTQGGEVPDYVHYHKVDFQLIYCLRGSIRVVYEDQGPPFWLEPGDCVLQPPEIRHRVLEAEAGSEVLELSSPAEHETWVDHEMSLPTTDVEPDRKFSRQRFVRSIASEAVWLRSESDDIEEREVGIFEATNGLADVRVRRVESPDITFSPRPGMVGIGFVVAGRESRDEPQTTATEILRLELNDLSLQSH
jgi:quercetin dioxygenase-like cupin family protein